MIRDLLTDLANDGEVAVDVEELRDYFGKVADMIFDELGIEFVDAGADGAVTATIRPPDGWV